MLSPTDDAVVADRTDAISFWGYHLEPGRTVQVRAWDYNANALVSVGPAATSATTSLPSSYFDRPLYHWETSVTLPERFWRAGPNGGHCAVTSANASVSGGAYGVTTVEQDWGRCYGDNPTAADFSANCRSDTGHAAIYTDDWGSVEINAASLVVAGLVASSELSLVLDNYTPTEYEFCSSANPSSCPDPSDPETYKFYRPNGSSLTANGDALPFTIVPSRDDPNTIYIDDFGSSGFDFSVQGGALVMGINFETSGPEIRTNCIRNFVCAFIDGTTIELGAPRAEIRFSLAASDGEVGYSDVAVDFTATGSDHAVQAAETIGAQMESMLRDDPGLRRTVGEAVGALIRRTAMLDEAYPIANVDVVGDGLRVRAGCPRD